MVARVGVVEPDDAVLVEDEDRRHGQDVVLFQILDKQELDPEFRSNVLLEDPETGEAVEVAPEFMREAYPERMRLHIASLANAAAGIGADHVLVNTSDSLDEALRNYLLFRHRRK